MFVLNLVHFAAAFVLCSLIGMFILSVWAERFEKQIRDEDDPTDQLL